jgi:flagellar biosynthesis chaperone FliJ
MAKVEYPLKQILQVKKKRVEDAEKVLREKLELLEKEKEKLKACEAERDKARDHYKDKLTQLRESLDKEMVGPKIQQMKAYLKVVQEKLAIEEKKVKDQQEQVKIAEKNVEDARKELQQKRMELDKLETHRVDWEKEQRKEREVIEGREQDELGNVIHGMHKRG